MVEYNTLNDKLSDSQLNKLKPAVKDRQGITPRTNVKMFDGNYLYPMNCYQQQDKQLS